MKPRDSKMKERKDSAVLLSSHVKSLSLSLFSYCMNTFVWAIITNPKNMVCS